LSLQAGMRLNILHHLPARECCNFSHLIFDNSTEKKKEKERKSCKSKPTGNLEISTR
jgi:hypothetical protein